MTLVFDAKFSHRCDHKSLLFLTCHEPPRLFELTYLDTQALNLFFHFHVLSRGELPRECVHLFFDQIVDGFPDAFEGRPDNLLLTFFIYLKLWIAVQMRTELWNSGRMCGSRNFSASLTGGVLTFLFLHSSAAASTLKAALSIHDSQFVWEACSSIQSLHNLIRVPRLVAWTQTVNPWAFESFNRYCLG
jgi:hypothetical protein